MTRAFMESTSLILVLAFIASGCGDDGGPPSPPECRYYCQTTVTSRNGVVEDTDTSVEESCSDMPPGAGCSAEWSGNDFVMDCAVSFDALGCNVTTVMNVAGTYTVAHYTMEGTVEITAAGDCDGIEQGVWDVSVEGFLMSGPDEPCAGGGGAGSYDVNVTRPGGVISMAGEAANDYTVNRFGQTYSVELHPDVAGGGNYRIFLNTPTLVAPATMPLSSSFGSESVNFGYYEEFWNPYSSGTSRDAVGTITFTEVTETALAANFQVTCDFKWAGEDQLETRSFSGAFDLDMPEDSSNKSDQVGPQLTVLKQLVRSLVADAMQKVSTGAAGIVSP